MEIHWDDFVEALIVGIDVSRDAKIAMIMVDGRQCRYTSINLEGIERLLVSEFRESNAIDNVKLWAADDSGLREALAVLISNSDEPAEQAAFKSVIERSRNQVASGTHVLLEIEPVYGAGVIAFAQKITCAERNS
jgi:acyl-[acyl carrier protein]--UDP-N-acetylglucosamine O-acyltransferase